VCLAGTEAGVPGSMGLARVVPPIGTLGRRLAFGLLTLVLAAGCYKTECEVQCADGFKETRDDKCSDVITPGLAAARGGNCTGHEKKHL